MGSDTTITEIPELVFEKLADNFAHAPEWLPKIIEESITRLGPIGVQRMRSAVMPNRYTGELDNSITAEYGSDGGLPSVTIGPTALRGGQWDAGMLLELGVPHPMPNVPYRAIAAWAGVRGAPMPMVWLGIRAHGIHAHPFLDNTVTNIEPDLDQEQEKVLDQMIEKTLEGTEP